jgi:hypothetical protein
MKTLSIFAASAAALVSTAALAYDGFDATTGTGFVSKGDVQLALGLNNKGIQDGTFVFAAVSEEVTATSWICTNDRNENTVELQRTTTTSIEGVVSAKERMRNQITGFNLTGYEGGTTVTTESDGRALNTCQNQWTLTTPAGEPDVISSSTTLTVNGVAL